MDKASNIKVDINRCKKIIEHQLGWSNDFVLTKREYDILIEKIFEKTGVLLSLSTIRRIWSDDFKNIPHKITLDALAAFTGYIDWQHFVETQSKNKETKSPETVVVIPTRGEAITTFRMFSENCRTVEAGLKSRA